MDRHSGEEVTEEFYTWVCRRQEERDSGLGWAF